MMIGWMHKMREATVILLQFVAVYSLLNHRPVGVVWESCVGFDRLYHCFLFATTSRKNFLDRYFVVPEFLCSCGLEPSIVRGN